MKSKDITYPPIIKLFAIFNLCALIIAAFVVGRNQSNFSKSLLFRGDFPAFYAAGTLVNTSPEKLYDPKAQSLIQNKYWPSENGEYLYYAYPPQLALLFSAIAKLSPRLAQNIWIALQIVSLCFSLYLFNKYVVNKTGNWIWDSLLSLFVMPLTVAILSGQNTAITILILTSSLILCSNVERRAQFCSGLVLGVMAYKPHMMLMVSSVMVLSRGKYFVFGLLSSVILQFIAVSWVLGTRWVSDWISALQFFNVHENQFNADGLISLIHVADFLLESVGVSRSLDPFAMSKIVYFLLLLFAMYGLVRLIRETSVQDYFKVSFGLLPAFVVFLSPHTMWYDFGILLLSIFYLLNLINKKSLVCLVVMWLVIINLLVAYRPVAFGIVISVISFVVLIVAILRNKCVLYKENLTFHR